MSLPLRSVRLRYEQDVVEARAQARALAALVGCSAQDQTRLATAVSEVARNALRYAGGGLVEFRVDLSEQLLWTEVLDSGPGIPELETLWTGGGGGSPGTAGGLLSTRRLMDHFELQSTPAGTRVRMAKRLPAGAPLGASDLAEVQRRLSVGEPTSPVQELQVQNQELLRALADLKRREDQLTALNHELEDTNRGVVALYSELEDKAARLREASQSKTMFLSHMSHEFRTPLNSILGLSRLLLGRQDGELSPEQDRQLTLLQASAHELLGTVNDLLDLAKVEAGKSELHLTTFAVPQTLTTLRALFQPLLPGRAVQLIVEDPGELPAMYSDEGKLHQILRNFVSNALNFTQTGEIRVATSYLAASLEAPSGTIEFSVQDSGIGVAPADLPRLFQQFSQVGQRPGLAAPGTGLGLALARQLAELLGGQVAAQSTLGVGSRFSVTLPLRIAVPPDAPDADAGARPAQAQP